jgi:hypothetical protein
MRAKQYKRHTIYPESEHDLLEKIKYKKRETKAGV